MKRLSLVLVAVALGALAIVGSALASHARPLSATPLTFQLVPAFQPATACAGTPSTHGAPLAVPSCNPPVPKSAYLTAASPDRAAPFNTAAIAKATVVLKVTCLTPGTTTQTGQNPPCSAVGDQIDVKIISTSVGVICTGAVGQLNCAGGAASNYNGKVLGSSTIQITDHDNTSGLACDPNCPGTVVPLPFTVGAQCTGGACNYTTSSDLTVPGVTKEGKRSVVELGPITVEDGGLDGDMAGSVACPPTCTQNGDGNNVASVQGLFVP